jgi:hypothetical protein
MPDRIGPPSVPSCAQTTWNAICTGSGCQASASAAMARLESFGGKVVGWMERVQDSADRTV